MAKKAIIILLIVFASVILLALFVANMYDVFKFSKVQQNIITSKDDHGCQDFVTVGICSDSTIRLEGELINNSDSLSEKISWYKLCVRGHVKIKAEQPDILMHLVDEVEKELIEANIYRIEYSVNKKICD